MAPQSARVRLESACCEVPVCRSAVVSWRDRSRICDTVWFVCRRRRFPTVTMTDWTWTWISLRWLREAVVAVRENKSLTTSATRTTNRTSSGSLQRQDTEMFVLCFCTVLFTSMATCAQDILKDSCIYGL